MEKLKALKDRLVNCAETQVHGHLNEVDAKELGEVIDMIKDLEEAIYYCTIVESMEEAEEDKEKHQPRYYNTYYYTTPERMYPMRDMDRSYGRMYYDGDIRYASNGGNSGSGMNTGNGRSGSSNTGSSGGTSYYGEPMYHMPFEYPYPMEQPMRDPREGRSGQSRKMFMESKEHNQDPAKQMKELEKYMQELTSDITEMVQKATPEEKQMLQQKISVLATKIK